MKKRAEAEKLADEALRSIDDIQAAAVNDFIFTRIQSAIAAKKNAAIIRKLKTMYRLSAILVLFIALNIGSYYILKQNKSIITKQKTSGIAAFADYYNLEQSSYNY